MQHFWSYASDSIGTIFHSSNPDFPQRIRVNDLLGWTLFAVESLNALKKLDGEAACYGEASLKPTKAQSHNLSSCLGHHWDAKSHIILLIVAIFSSHAEGKTCFAWVTQAHQRLGTCPLVHLFISSLIVVKRSDQDRTDESLNVTEVYNRQWWDIDRKSYLNKKKLLVNVKNKSLIVTIATNLAPN